jgi:hypothetical protein
MWQKYSENQAAQFNAKFKFILSSSSACAF